MSKCQFPDGVSTVHIGDKPLDPVILNYVRYIKM